MASVDPKRSAGLKGHKRPVPGRPTAPHPRFMNTKEAVKEREGDFLYKWEAHSPLFNDPATVKANERKAREYAKQVKRRMVELVRPAHVFIAVSEATLRAVLRAGRFMAFNEIKTSGGSMKTQGTRDQLESFYYRFPRPRPARFRATEADMSRPGYIPATFHQPAMMDHFHRVRPIYGYLSPDLDGLNGAIAQYGTIHVRLRDSVKVRTTFNIGDSLDDNPSVVPSPVRHPSFASSGALVFASELPPEQIRWSNVGKGRLFKYVEAQIHGGVDLKDIQEVVFDHSPAPAVRELLKTRQIAWRIR